MQCYLLMREGRRRNAQTARAVGTLLFPFAFGSMWAEGGMVCERTGFAQTHSNLGADAIPASTRGLKLSPVTPPRVKTGCANASAGDSPRGYFSSAISRPCLQRLLHHLSMDKGNVTTEG